MEEVKAMAMIREQTSCWGCGGLDGLVNARCERVWGSDYKQMGD